MRRSSMILALTMAAMWSLVAPGCRPSEPADAPPDSQVRIVSLSPAISRTLLDLELHNHIVGRTPYCSSLDPAVPIVGDLLNLDVEQLVRVRPTHVFLQPPASGMDPALATLSEQHGWTIKAWRLDSIDDVQQMLDDLPDALVELDLHQRAGELNSAITEAMQGDAETFTRPTLLVFSADPVSVFGEGTYLHDVLTGLGGTNAIAMQGYPQLTLEDVTRIRPEAIILVQPGAEAAANTPLHRLDVPASRDGRIAVLTHEDALMPSSGIIGVADEMRRLLQSLKGSP